MDLEEAEGWFAYWETIGLRWDKGAQDERSAASLLHEEYDRRGEELEEDMGVIRLLRRQRDQAEAENEILRSKLRSQEHGGEVL